MRNITIDRRKSFVGSLGTFRVYAEDPAASEMIIRGVPCRKVGEMKNGEQTTFQLGDEETRLFVINGQASKNYCVEMYRLPAGNTDAFLGGVCKFNPAAGNAFRFDDNDSEEAKAVRKRGTKSGTLITVISIIVGALVGIGFGVARASLNKGINSSTSSTAKNGTGDGHLAFPLVQEAIADRFCRALRFVERRRLCGTPQQGRSRRSAGRFG